MWQAWEKREMGGQREGRKLFGKYESNIQSELKEYDGWI
jgi:hypothetical protein